jgi:hypothetical protein
MQDDFPIPFNEDKQVLGNEEAARRSLRASFLTV